MPLYPTPDWFQNHYNFQCVGVAKSITDYIVVRRDLMEAGLAADGGVKDAFPSNPLMDLSNNLSTVLQPILVVNFFVFYLKQLSAVYYMHNITMYITVDTISK